MKKIVLILSMMVFICGCDMQVSEEHKEYQETVQLLEEKKVKHFDQELPFQVDVSIDSLVEGELVYSVVIDQPKVPMKHVKALVVHDSKTNDIFPSTGIFDTALNLIPENIDEKKGNVKGIALVGYIKTNLSVTDFHTNLRLFVSYEDEDGNRKQFYSYHKI